MDFKAHQVVLEEWRKRPPHDTETFVSDGPIDADRWRKSGRRRVLFLAKEAYGEIGPGKTWDLPKLVREDWEVPRSKFWWTLGYWAYGVQRLTNGPIPPNPKAGELWVEVTEAILASAVVNIKKSGGRSRSNEADLRQHVSNDADLLKKQVECLRPDVMVCCNTWHLVKDVWPHAKHVSEQVYKIDRMWVLDFWHPANHYPDVMNYYTVVLLLHRALFPC